MLPRFHWSDITTVGHYLGDLIIITGAAMLMPAAIALVFNELFELGAFVAGIGICFFLGSLLRLLPHRELDRRRSLLLVGFGWIAIGIVASSPFMFSGAYESWFDALFDSVSALTSTGVSIARDIDCMSYAQITWHVLLSFGGAMGVISIALYMGFFGEGSKLHIKEDRHSGKHKRTRLVETWIFIMRIFAFFAILGTIAASIVCWDLGMDPVNAIMNGFWLACCAVGTSGFVPHSSDLVYYHAPQLQLVLAILMIAGALSIGIFMLFRKQQYRQILRNSELRVYAIWMVVLVIFVIGIMTREDIINTLVGLFQNGLMTVISSATTCGMQTVYPEQMGGVINEGISMWIIVAMFFGACAYSTGGGVKIVRILEVLHWIRYSILRRLAPDTALVRIKYEQFGTRDLSARDATLAMNILIMYMITAALGSMAFIAYGYDALNSVFETISYLSNCGMITGISQEGLPLTLKIVALLLMWVGRVEFVALIAAIVGIVISLLPGNLFSNMRSRNLRTLKKENSGGTAWRRRKGQKPRETKTLVVALALLCAIGSMGLQGAPAMAVQSGAGAEVSVEEVESLGIADTYHKEEVLSLLKATLRQNKRNVVFSGEAIGEALSAGPGFKWVNIKEDGSTIGVLMSDEQADFITKYARYGCSGDIVQIKGTFHLACPEHADSLEVHADSVELIDAGTLKEIAPIAGSYICGLIGLFAAFILTIINNKRRGRPLLKLRR